MKVVYLGKRKIKVIAAAAMALALVALAVFLWQAPSTAVSAAQNKQIPVYCVSTEEKRFPLPLTLPGEMNRQKESWTYWINTM